MLKFFDRALNNKKGFTLIEVLVVIAIIGILIAMAAPRVIKRIEDAKVSSDRVTAKVLNDAILTFELDQIANPSKYDAGWTTADIEWSELKEYLEDGAVATQEDGKTAIADTTKVYDETAGPLVIYGKSKNPIQAFPPNGVDSNGIAIPATKTKPNTSTVYQFFLVGAGTGTNATDGEAIDIAATE